MKYSLSGSWDFRLDHEQAWRVIAVPGCWEALGIARNDPGPGWYRRQVQVPPGLDGKRLWLRFEGVSYACTVFVDGQEVGSHVGLWDGFRLEITHLARPGETVEVVVRVEKSASLMPGPESPHVPGRYPQKETLSGFLPYVWGHMFGGIWQDVWLEASGETAIEEFFARGNADGQVQIEARLSRRARLELTVLGPDGEVLEHVAPPGPTPGIILTGGLLHMKTPRPWSPESPALYKARVRVEGGEERTIRFGLRSVRAEGSTLLLNEHPIYPRMILSWGWYEQSLHANPGPEQVRRDFARLKEMGYNGVKLCLWVPPAYYFDIADEIGMLLWLELPMWMPEITPYFLKQTPAEYERIVRQVRHHPSLILYTLGCELDAKVRAEFLEPLYRQTKALVGDALLRDNSGSGEAYGGLLNEFAEFYDYHFYSDIQFLRPLLDYFSPRWRPAQPFFFGEFCDSDTWRDLRKLRGADGEVPWWAKRDAEQNPQGARWQLDLPELEERIRAAGLWDRQEELVEVSHRQALLHRKFTLELVRTYAEISGYVVTGERDTPISTAGMWTGPAESGDDQEHLKFDPARFAAFNGDVLLSLGWDRRRAWIHGGDRAAYWDTFSYAAGSTLRAHIIASNHSRLAGAAIASWSVELSRGTASPGAERSAPEEKPWRWSSEEADPEARSPHGFSSPRGGGSGEAVQLVPGEVREVAVAEFVVPEVEHPTRATLRAAVRVGGGAATENEWSLWFFPYPRAGYGRGASSRSWGILPAVRLVDPPGRLDSVGAWLRVDDAHEVVLATEWTPGVRRHVEAGGRAILLQAGRGPAGPLATVPLPFWREAVKLIEPHPAWGDFPHEGFCDLQFFGLATDHALETTHVTTAGATPQQSCGITGARPILRRLDARTAAVHDYAVELEFGAGRVIVSTLRFEGGLGEQPLGLSRNTAAAYLLGCWVRYLSA